MITSQTPIAEAAETYVSLGLSPIPLFGIRPDGSCTCGKRDCSAQGKHPVGFEWQKQASNDLDRVRDRFRSHVGNVGVYLSGQYVLIDVDGDEGYATTAEWPLPPTLTALSGSQQGGHWIYRLQAHQSAEKITDRRIAPGVDVKVRGQFVAAPSLHVSGNRYEWLDLRAPADLPDWLYARICKPAVTQPPPRQTVPGNATAERVRAWVRKADPAVSGAGGHNKTYAVACKIAAQGLEPDDEWEILSEYNQRCDPPWSDSELRHKLDNARRMGVADPLPDRPRLRTVPADETPATDTSWMSLCLWESRKSGPSRLARVTENAVVILQNDHRWKGRVKLDEFAQDVALTDPPWPAHHVPQSDRAYWTDGDTARMQAWLLREHELPLSVPDIERAVMMVAENAAFNSARDWMAALQWDGVARLNSWLSVYLGSEDSAYTRAVGRWWIISAVARVFQAGCKADHMLILYGDQGRGKSSAAGILAGPQWFADSAINIGDKDAYLALRGKLIVEMAELESLNRAESNAIKSFLTSRVDNYRPPYARRAVDVPRRCVFIGTTNNDEMLKDDTGDRRFWPVTCGAIDRSGLATVRDQIWAEAVREYRAGATWYPETAEDRELCETAQLAHKQTHPWQAAIASWLEARELRATTVQVILGECLSVPKSQWSDAVSKTVAGCLKRLGWHAKNDRGYDDTKRRYYSLDR